MFLSNAVRMSKASKGLVVLAMVILAGGAATAFAATVSGDGTLIGTTGNDTITAGNGNDTVFGLGGSDTITAGNGNDVIDANGHCLAGVTAGDYPNGLPNGEYCEHGQIPSNNADLITAGKGNDTIYAGGGPNAIDAGCGNDTIDGGPVADAIVAGTSKGCQADDQIYLGLGPSYDGSAVATGAGDDVIHAQNGVTDYISCGKGNGTTVYADKSDVVKGCARVIYTPDPNPGPNPRLARRLRAHSHQEHHRLATTRAALAALLSHHDRAAMRELRAH